MSGVPMMKELDRTERELDGVIAEADRTIAAIEGMPDPDDIPEIEDIFQGGPCE